MADPRFFNRSKPMSLGEIAKYAQADLHNPDDAQYLIEDVAPLQSARSCDISFLDNVKYRDNFSRTQAGACIVHESQIMHAPKGLRLLISRSPYKSYALTAQAFYPEILRAPQISLQAFIDSTAVIGDGCVIECGAVIKAGVQIGAKTYIESCAVIAENVVIGSHCRVGANATLSHCIIGDYVRLYPGVRIGQDGFGFAIDPSGFYKVPQLGRVIIEDHVEIGANTCIDRGSGPDTVIGQGTWIDNLVQIGHNVKVGKGCIMAAQVGIAGSTILEDYIALGGQAGIAGHLKIGKGARIAAQSGVIRDVPAGEEQMGYPAFPIKEYMRQVAILKRLIKKDKSA